MTGRARPGGPVWLVVCGERERGDDAAGPVAIDGLPLELLARCELRMAAGLDVQTLVDLPTDAACVLVDAALGIEPGAVVVLPLERLLRGDPAGRRGAAPRSSHELSVPVALGLAGVLRGSIPTGSFVGIGAAASALGEGLSPPVESGLPAFRDAIAAEIRRYAGP